MTELSSRLEAELERGRDSSLLRFALARSLMASGAAEKALVHLDAAVEMSPTYSAAWGQLGKCKELLGDTEGAVAAWLTGSRTSLDNGDIQAHRQMEVWLRRMKARTGE